MSEITTEAQIAGWKQAIDMSILSTHGFERAYKFSSGQVDKWISGIVLPREKSIKKMEDAVVDLRNRGRPIPWHPSFGYATNEQIERLKQAIPEWERQSILKQIDKQTKLQGKVD